MKNRKLLKTLEKEIILFSAINANLNARAFINRIFGYLRANKDLLDKDIIKGVPYEQIQQNIKNGKYRLPPQTKKEYPEPHRDPATGKIIIENCTLYNQDLMNYNGYQVMEWTKQGKYNLSPAELEKEREKYKEKQEALSKKYANKNINYLR